MDMLWTGRRVKLKDIRNNLNMSVVVRLLSTGQTPMRAAKSRYLKGKDGIVQEMKSKNLLFFQKRNGTAFVNCQKDRLTESFHLVIPFDDQLERAANDHPTTKIPG